MGNGGIFSSVEQLDMKLMNLYRGSKLRMVENTNAFTLCITFVVQTRTSAAVFQFVEPNS